MDKTNSKNTNFKLQDISNILVILFLLIFGFYIASEFLIPLSYAALLSMLMLPFCRWMEGKGLSRASSSFLCILLLISGVFILIAMMSSQLLSISDDLPAFQSGLSKRLDGIQTFIEQKTKLSPEKQIFLIKSKSFSFLSTAGSYFTNILYSTTAALGNFILIIIYIFFFLFYRLRIFNFIIQVMPGKSHEATIKTLKEITKVTTAYITGMLIVIGLLAALNFIGFLIIGVPHALFFALLIALLNTIPYIGVWVGSFFPVMLMLIMHDGFGPAIGVIAVIAIAQFIEGNFLTPKIVGSKVKINAMAAIMAIILGGVLWGTSGMILFIPFLGIAKVIFDNIEKLSPLAYIIGDEEKAEDNKTVSKKIAKKIKVLFSK